MSENVLSQAEVESLLSSVSKESAPEQQSSAFADQLLRSRDKVDTYDFRRPDRVGKDQVRALQSLHESVGRNFGAALSAMLRTIVDVRLTSVDQLTYSEFLLRLEAPTCCNILRADPLASHFILDMHPSVLYPIVDRLLGGGKEPQQVFSRPLTEIELRLVSRVTDKFLAELKNAWMPVVELDLSVERVESNPQLAQIVPPNEVVVLVCFELTIGDSRGMLNLCLPYNSLSRVAHKLSANSWDGDGRGEATDESHELIRQRLTHAEVELVVTLAKTKISTGDLVELQVGDIITTDHDIHDPIEIAVEGIPKFAASPGAWKGRKAVEIRGPIAPAS